MHNHSFDISLDEITKVEGAAALDLKVRDGKVEEVRFQITEFKRFYTQGVRGKEATAAPQHLARICGTCSNAHLACNIEAIERGLDIHVSDQVKLMRRLAVNGLMIRDHGLHLYVFCLPDVVGKGSILEFDESNAREHQLLHDTFTLKGAGNQLSIAFGGRSVHAPHMMVGGFTEYPTSEDIATTVSKLKEAREPALRLIDEFKNSGFELIHDADSVALRGEGYDFLEGIITSTSGETTKEADYRAHLEKKVIPYSQAHAYTFKGSTFIVGALARLNLSKDQLHPNTQRDAKEAIAIFPSKNIFHNNLAQAIETLHCIDESIELLENNPSFEKEEMVTSDKKDGVGIGVVEAPRGTLYHKMVIEGGIITDAEIIVPTGQNQISMEQNVKKFVEEHLDLGKETLRDEIEKLIRAYDPCMSCATHFLKIRWL